MRVLQRFCVGKIMSISNRTRFSRIEVIKRESIQVNERVTRNESRGEARTAKPTQ